jgi:hypothetical protein
MLVGTKRRKVGQIATSPSIISGYGIQPEDSSFLPISTHFEIKLGCDQEDTHLNIDQMLKSGSTDAKFNP